jgi:hypothetical protein
MLYELRIYTAVPGRMPQLLARFKDHTVAIWQKHGIVPIGFWTPWLVATPPASSLTFSLGSLSQIVKSNGVHFKAIRNGCAFVTKARRMEPLLRISAIKF